ncbi:MAG: DUF6279 family lipoprotein [Pseudobdellovibrionaceae bacterium]
MKKTFLKYGSLLLFILGSLSCSRLDIAVNWADTYIIYQVDDYFDISSQQSKELKESLKKDFLKIRHEQFNKWAATLRQFNKNILENTLSEEIFHDYFTKTLEASRQLPTYFVNTAVKFIASTNQTQLEHFEKTVRKKNIEDQKKIQNGETARNESRKKYLRWIDMWIGPLSKEQTQLLNQHLNTHPFPAQAQLANKIYILEKFHESRKSPEGLKNFVRNYYNNKYEVENPEYLQALAAYQTELEKFLFQLIQSLNEKQKRTLSENLSEKSSALEKLSVSN